MEKRGFEISYHRAEETQGDSDHYPRTNVLERLEGERSGPCVHFKGHLDVVIAGSRWKEEPFAITVRENRIYG